MPLIALTASMNDSARTFSINTDYVSAVLRAGATPVLLPIAGDENTWAAMLSLADAFIFTGGADVDPAEYQEETLPCCEETCRVRDRQERYLIRGAMRLGKPFLGICRGMQLCNCVLGGSLYQDIATQYSTALRHPRSDIGREYAHAVSLTQGSTLRSLLGLDSISVNSRHHQGIKTLGKGLIASALAPDGLVEAYEMADSYPALCVQWHPESLADRYCEAQALFDWLAARASA